MLKRIIPVVLLLLCCCFVQALPSQTENKPEGEAAPSLEETTAWLKEKISSYGGYTQRKGDELDVEKFEAVSFDGCTLNYTWIRESQLKLTTLVYAKSVSAVPLADIDAGSIAIEDKKTHRLLILSTVNGKKTIKNDFALRAPGMRLNNSDPSDKAKITFADAEMAGRVAKAFARAVELCKKKKEPF